VPEFQPFTGIRYNNNRVFLDDVIAPPYDVVNSDDRKNLCQKSPYNSIKIELPNRDLPSGADPYQQAAREFASWQLDNILLRDQIPSFYIYRMTFDSPTEVGQKNHTSGVIGALKLDKTGTMVLPHEQTMPKPKGDRLDLLRASKTNVSPIWALSLTKGLSAICRSITDSSSPTASAKDEDDNQHELWVVSDEAKINEIKNLVGATPLIIADGHHRYETALHYQAEHTVASNDTSLHAYDYLMTFVVELTKEELVVRAIHRLISGLENNFDFVDALSSDFELSDGPDSPIELERNLHSYNSMGLITKTKNYFLKPTKLLLEKDETELDSSRLDIALAQLPTHHLTYQHGANQIYNAVMTGEAQAGILLRPATVEQIAATAHLSKRMPPKTTYFHPKPRTGMVFRPLE